MSKAIEFTLNGVNYTSKNSNSCSGCAFNTKAGRCSAVNNGSVPKCSYDLRSNVIFVVKP